MPDPLPASGEDQRAQDQPPAPPVSNITRKSIGESNKNEGSTGSNRGRGSRSNYGHSTAAATPARNSSGSTSTSTSIGLERHSPRLPQLLPARTRLPTSSSLSSSRAASVTDGNNSSQSQNGFLPPATSLSCGSSASPLSASSGSLPPRMSQTRVACEACRRRRIKCSGDRPECIACVKSSAQCVYFSVSSAETNTQALKRRIEQTEDEKNVYSQLYDKIRSIPEEEAHGLVRRLRMGASPSDILKQTREGDLLPQSFPVRNKRPRFEFPYRDVMPSVIQQSGSAYLSSWLHAPPTGGIPEQDNPQGDEQGQERHERSQHPTAQHEPQYLSLCHLTKLIDPRLHAVNVTRWTQVITDRELFVDLLSRYLLWVHPQHSIIHKDTFLRALVDGDNRFCSPLLVNSIMTVACHFYGEVPNRARPADPLALGYRFMAEAKRLWELRSPSCTILKAQAATLLSMAYFHDGLDQIGYPYLEEAITIARKLGILDSELTEAAADMCKAKIVTAWGIFGWAAMLGYHLKRPSIMNASPMLGLPSPAEKPQLYGELLIQHRSDDGLQTIDLGAVSGAWSSLRCIMNDVASAAYSGPEHNAMSAQRWLIFKQQCERWYSNLPLSLAPQNIVWPAQLALHMEYFLVLINLCRERLSEYPGHDSANVHSAAQEVASNTAQDAITELETLIRLYHLRHSFKDYNSSLMFALWTLANIITRQRHSADAKAWDPETAEHTKSTLLLCLQGLADQAQCSYFAAVLCKVQFNKQTAEDGEFLRSYVDLGFIDDGSTFGQDVLSAFPVEMDAIGGSQLSTLKDLMAMTESGEMAFSAPEETSTRESAHGHHS